MNKANPDVQVVQVKPLADNTERQTTAEQRAHIDKVDKVFVVPDTGLIGMDQSDFKNSASESAATSDERVSIHYIATILSDIAVIAHFHPLPSPLVAHRTNMARVCYISQRLVLMVATR